jgi:hypothetical protein
VVQLEEEHQRHELLVRRVGLRRQHPVPPRAPPQAGPVREQVAAARPRLAVEHGDRAEVGVRTRDTAVIAAR